MMNWGKMGGTNDGEGGGLKVIGNKSSNKKRQQCTVIVVFPLFDNMMRAKRI